MKKSRLKVSAPALLAAATFGVAPMAIAQNAGDTATSTDERRLDQVTVTTQRTAQNQQDVPIAITTLSAETLFRTGTDNLEDLTAITPGLAGKNEGVATSIYSIRGINSNSIGVGGENSVGVFVDDVFIGRQALSGIGFLDAERIEVVKGPQGTLFGRNSTAGAISIVSKKPGDTFEGELRGQFSDLNSTELFGGVSIPIVEDKFSVRIAGLFRDRDGTWTDVVRQQDVGNSELSAGRIAARWNITPNLTADAFYSIWREETGGFSWTTTDPTLAAIAGSSTDPFDRTIAHDAFGREVRDADVAGLTLTYDVNDDVTLKSITSYTKLDDTGFTDLDASILPLFTLSNGPDSDLARSVPQVLADASPQETFGQEFRLNGSTDKIEWLVGASYFGEEINDPRVFQFNDVLFLGGTPIDADAFFPGSPAFFLCDATSDALLGIACNPTATESDLIQGDYESYAIYGDFRYSVTDALTTTFGLRYSYDEKEFTYRTFITPSVSGALGGGSVVFPDTGGLPVTLENDWSDLQPRFVLDYRWNEDLLTYVSISKGFKSGGFDVSFNVADIPFDEESVWAYEVGVKSDFANGRAVLNAAAYFNDYEGFQVQPIINGITQTVNIPTLDNYGFEVELLARPTDNLDLNFGLAYNDSEFSSLVIDSALDPTVQVDLEGNRIPVTSEWTFNGAGEYRKDFGDRFQGYVRGDVSYRSGIFETIENLDVFSIDGYWLANARIGIAAQDGNWDISLFARNLADEEYLVFNNTLGFGATQIAGTPREYGLELRKTF